MTALEPQCIAATEFLHACFSKPKIFRIPTATKVLTPVIKKKIHFATQSVWNTVNSAQHQVWEFEIGRSSTSKPISDLGRESIKLFCFTFVMKPSESSLLLLPAKTVLLSFFGPLESPAQWQNYTPDICEKSTEMSGWFRLTLRSSLLFAMDIKTPLLKWQTWQKQFLTDE